MTSQLEKEIEALKELLLAMAGHAEDAVTRSIRALGEPNDELARLVISQDVVVDRCEVEIDEKVITLLCKALLATDLRMTIVAMKISHELERVSDEATTIARRAIALRAEPEPGPPVEIQRMAGMARGMLEEAVGAFANRRPEKARAVISRDEEIDALNKRHRRDLTAQMTSQRGGVNACIHLMVVSKCLERIADHSVSIAEEAVYLCDAE
jgi:phosphate transport system protein